MKAIIMAGGKGTRLKPLTCAKPKPMVYLANNPVMTHTIELLKKYDITDIGVTLQHMASQIMDYYSDGREFGVNLEYFIEDIPLGTAGSVKNAQNFLDDTFLVISGDGLTDINIQEAIEFHKNKKSLATLILTSVANPLEYGIVVTQKNGEIIKFLEKPSWGEVFSDQVNTGMYILEPEVLDFIPKKIFYDFSKNLFPLLMDKGISLYGFNAKGYWCDIGNCQAYLEAHLDILGEKVVTFQPYQEQAAKIWIGKNTEIHPSARLNPPLVIGDNCHIGPFTSLGPKSFIGDNCIIGPYSSLKHSILWKGVQIGKEVKIRGGVICSKVNIKNGVSIYEGTIIGPESTLDENCTIKPNARIWPSKTIGEGAVLEGNLVWGTKFTRNIFGINGIKGQLNIDLTMERILQLGSAFGSIIKANGNIGISTDGSNICATLKQALVCGLQIVGQQVYDLGELTLPLCRFAVNKGNLDAGIYLKFDSEDNLLEMILLNEQGANISKSLEKKIENSCSVNDFRYIPSEKIKDIKQRKNIYELYLRNLKKEIKEKLDFKILITSPCEKLSERIQNLLEDLGCMVTIVKEEKFEKYLNEKKELALAFKFDKQAEKVIIYDEQGNKITAHQFKVLISYILFNNYKKLQLIAAIDETSVLEELAQKFDSRVIRCKTDLSNRMENMLQQGEYGLKQFFMEFDGVYAVLNILQFLKKENTKLAMVINNLPKSYVHKDILNCPWDIKGKIIRKLLENFSHESINSIEGAKFIHPKGHILVLPDLEKPLVNIIAESSLMEMAQEISGNFKKKIQGLISNHN